MEELPEPLRQMTLGRHLGRLEWKWASHHMCHMCRQVGWIGLSLDEASSWITCHSIGISMGPDVWNPMVSRTPEARATGQSVCLGNIKNMRILAQKEGTTMWEEC